MRREKSLIGEHSPALEKVLPLLGGEGRGEGERAFQLNRSGAPELFRRSYNAEVETLMLALDLSRSSTSLRACS